MYRLYKAKRGRKGYSADGDHIKGLFSLDDDYDCVINKAATMLEMDDNTNIRLISKNAIVPKEAFRTLEQFMAASFIKPDKLRLGLTDSGMYKICSNWISIAYTCAANTSKFLLFKFV